MGREDLPPGRDWRFGEIRLISRLGGQLTTDRLPSRPGFNDRRNSRDRLPEGRITAINSLLIYCGGRESPENANRRGFGPFPLTEEFVCCRIY